MIFISHAAADKELAATVSDYIEQRGCRTFLSSRPGDIQADADSWEGSVRQALRDAEAYLILLTPNSIYRPWVSFETGAAWFSERRCILVRAAGLEPQEIPAPLEFKQVYSLEVLNDAKAIFRALRVEHTDLDMLVKKIATMGRETKLAGAQEPAWEGVEFDGAFYA